MNFIHESSYVDSNVKLGKDIKFGTFVTLCLEVILVINVH